jgi:hypothetical protein
MDTSTPATCPFHAPHTLKGQDGPVSAHSHRTLKNLPGPGGLPILGNILQLDLTKLHSIRTDRSTSSELPARMLSRFPTHISSMRYCASAPLPTAALNQLRPC